MDENWLKPQTAQDLFDPGHRIILGFASNHMPVYFRCEVSFCEGRWLGLNLPPAWQGVTELAPGMHVRLSKSLNEGIFSVRGRIMEVRLPVPPHLIIERLGEIRRDQRRLFYRLAAEQDWTIQRAMLPDGRELAGLKARMMDISASGVGFRLGTFLAPGSRLQTANLFECLPEFPACGCELDVVWCRPQRALGYRGGAVILHADPRDQDRLNRIIVELQRRRLAQKSARSGLETL